MFKVFSCAYERSMNCISYVTVNVRVHYRSDTQEQNPIQTKKPHNRKHCFCGLSNGVRVRRLGQFFQRSGSHLLIQAVPRGLVQITQEIIQWLLGS